MSLVTYQLVIVDPQVVLRLFYFFSNTKKFAIDGCSVIIKIHTSFVNPYIIDILIESTWVRSSYLSAPYSCVNSATDRLRIGYGWIISTDHYYQPLGMVIFSSVVISLCLKIYASIEFSWFCPVL